MALETHVGTFQNSPITAPGFTPKALIVWSATHSSGDTLGVNANIAIGFATRRGGTTQQKSASISYTDNVGTADARKTWFDALCGALTLDSFDANGFTVSGTDGSTVYNYLAIGGSDVTDACVVEDDWPTSGATFDVIGAGFTPGCAVYITGVPTSLAVNTQSTTGGAELGFGVFAGSGQWSAGITFTDADTMASTMNNNSVFSQDACLTSLTQNADTVDAKGIFSAFTSDGATITNTNAPTAALRVFALYLQGGQYKAGSKAKTTSAAADSFTFNTPTFTPVGVLLAQAVGTTSNTVVAATAEFTVGAASAVDGSEEGYAGLTSIEAINTQADHLYSATKAIAELTPGAVPAIDAAADMTAFGDGSFELTWDATGTAGLVGFLAMGSAPKAFPFESHFPQHQRQLLARGW